NLDDGVSLTGSIDGGAGNDTLSYAAYTTAVDVVLSGSDGNGFSGTGTGLTGFSGIDVLAGGSGSDSLTGEDVDSTWSLGSSQTYNDGSQTLAFSAFETLNGGSGKDAFNVTQTTSGASLTLNGNGGDDTFSVTTLDNIAGDLTVDGGSGTNTLDVDDSAKTSGVSWAVDTTTIQRESAGQITYGSMATVTITAGSGDDAIDIEATPSGTTVTFDAGGGTNDIEVAQVGNNLDAIQGEVVLAGSVNDTVTINDQLNADDVNVSLDEFGLSRTNSASLTFNTSFSQVVFYGGSGTNTVDVTPSGNTTFWLDGGLAGTSILNYHTGGSTTYQDDGSTISDTGLQSVFYFDFGTVNHPN
ncbi:MAG TPA: hypothetical protein VFA26_16145, partial [Gemmataceae bacterium]|nr:hypothetical protein [Gemmataceae bacterium]